MRLMTKQAAKAKGRLVVGQPNRHLARAEGKYKWGTLHFCFSIAVTCLHVIYIDTPYIIIIFTNISFFYCCAFITCNLHAHTIHHHHAQGPRFLIVTSIPIIPVRPFLLLWKGFQCSVDVWPSWNWYKYYYYYIMISNNHFKSSGSR